MSAELHKFGGHLAKRERSRSALCGLPTKFIPQVPRSLCCARCVVLAGRLLERKRREPSQLEELFASLAPSRLGTICSSMVREYRFGESLGRHWRFDFAWPDLAVAVELDGGSYLPMSRHGSGPGRDAEVIRDAAATLLGWRVFRVTRAVLKSGACWSWLACALHGKMPQPSMFPKPSELRPKRVRAATVRA